MNKAALVILVLAFTSSAFGMVFSWTDSSGTRHFSNRRDEIPERYRAKAKPLYPEQADVLPVQQNAPAQPVKAVIPQVASPAVQQGMPQEPPKTVQSAVTPAAPIKEVAPATGRKDRRRPTNPRDE